ncbi:MAG: hypothetical protein EXR93_05410 [Gemmatimonadetes bacterium]|nr:hypothetical protein [Gemmatimonadota bacterium]
MVGEAMVGGDKTMVDGAMVGEAKVPPPSPFPPSPFILSLFLLVVVLAGCADAFTTDVNVVARAGYYELTVDRLGEMFAQGKALTAERDVVKRVAQLWVDYALYAQHAVTGDSMLSTSDVLAVLWPEVQQRRADHFHDALVAAGVKLDSSTVDSTYEVGDLRLIRHVLIRTEPAMAPPAKAARLREAESIRARLRSGGTWAEANRRNQDPRAKAENGSLGVVFRGALMGPVEDAAFGLAPGGMSEIVESPLGYHVVTRPRLRDARTEFITGVEDRLIGALDSAYLGGMAARRQFKVRNGAAARARVAIADPLGSARSGAVLATFDGGTFTVADLVRWVDAMPPQLRGQIDRADDDQLVMLISQMMRNQAMMVEADSAGVTLTPLDITEFKDLLRRDLDMLSKALGIDARALPDSGLSVEGKIRMAGVKVDEYLEAVTANRANFVAVPTFLSARLREKSDWRVISAGIDRVLARAEALRAAIDSARAASPTPPSVPDSGGKKE